MSNTDDIRWQQRLENFEKALNQLEVACQQDEYSMLERAGLVQVFQFSFELAWKTMKDLLFIEGFDEKSPRSVIRRSFEVAYLSEKDAEVLLDSLKKRNLLSHTYEESIAEQAQTLIKEDYLPALQHAYHNLKNRS
ncbi:MAG: HI0074 family nucleotidyltransferase substrate-binding subunit [Mariprofundaceae bacterium]|nr:HI0074 family nucleotidyltransferase substrate-binding subunit [Mariprofundaceae bacterium]